jgi:hypothetical protein
LQRTVITVIDVPKKISRDNNLMVLDLLENTYDPNHGSLSLAFLMKTLYASLQ